MGLLHEKEAKMKMAILLQMKTYNLVLRILNVWFYCLLYVQCSIVGPLGCRYVCRLKKSFIVFKGPIYKFPSHID